MKWLLLLIGPILTMGIGLLVVFLALILIGVYGKAKDKREREDFLIGILLFGMFGVAYIVYFTFRSMR